MSAAVLSRISLVAFATLEAACRTAAPSLERYDLSASSADSVARRQRNVLGRAEFELLRAASAYDVVQQYRPEFLRQRNVGAAATTVAVASVYIDGNRQGGAEVLRRIPAAVVDEIRYLSPTAASMEFGRAGSGGIILVRLRR